MIAGAVTLILAAVLMLTVLYDQRTKQDGLTVVILWLSKALYALANGWARFRLGMVAAAGSAVRETKTAWREAV
jgi:hypothetical protein